MMTATTASRGFDGFARSLLLRIRQDLSTQPRLNERVQRELGQWESQVRLGPVSITRRRSDVGQSEAGIDALYTELSRLWTHYVSGQLVAVLIFIDDANNLLATDPHALLSLRALFQDLQGHKMVYPLVISGPENMFEATRDASEPVTRFFERLPIGPFTRQDTEEAVVEPLKAVHYPIIVESSAIDMLYARTLGHPYFVAFAMRELIDTAALQNTTVLDDRVVTQAWSTVAERLGEEKFAAEWNQATEAERDVLQSIARAEPISRAKRSGATLATRLVAKGLVLKQSRGQYTLYHPLFQEYVLRND